jgi:hypothetical protein
MNKTYLAVLAAVALLVAGALWYTRTPEDASIPQNTGLAQYAYTCDRDMAFLLSPSEDMSAILISPIPGAAYPPLATLTDSPTDTGRRYRSAELEFQGRGEMVTLYDVIQGDTYTCEPHAKPDEAPLNWGD